MGDNAHTYPPDWVLVLLLLAAASAVLGLLGPNPLLLWALGIGVVVGLTWALGDDFSALVAGAVFFFGMSAIIRPRLKWLEHAQAGPYAPALVIIGVAGGIVLMMRWRHRREEAAERAGPGDGG